MEPITVEFTFTPDSFGKAQIYIMFLYLKNSMLKWVLLIAAVVYVATEFFYGDSNWLKLLNMLIWVPFFLGAWWVVFRWLSRRNFHKYTMMQHPIRYTFTDENLQLTTYSAESTVQWNAIQKVEEARDFFLLYQSAQLISPLMKSGFKSEAEQERFRTLLHTKQLFKG